MTLNEIFEEYFLVSIDKGVGKAKDTYFLYHILVGIKICNICKDKAAGISDLSVSLR